MALVKVELSNPKGMAVIVPLIRYNEKHEDQLFEGHVPQTYLDTVLQCLDAELESKIEIFKPLKLDGTVTYWLVTSRSHFQRLGI